MQNEMDCAGHNHGLQEAQEEQETSRQCESSDTAEEDALSRSKSLSSDSKMTRSDLNAPEDVTKGLLVQESTSAPLLDQEAGEHTEQVTLQSDYSGMLRSRHGTKGELVVAHCCCSIVHMPLLCLGDGIQ